MYPPDFACPAEKTETAEYVARTIALLAADRRVVVQAGGCAGLWPLALARHFEHVHTFEPDPTNYRVLCTNIGTAANITAHPCAVGDRRDKVGLTREKAGAGLWRVTGAGAIPMVRLDDAMDGPVDALVLDVEGSEVAALRGAERLIDTYHPLVWCEYLHDADGIDALLAAHGYRRRAHGNGADYYSVHTSRVH